MWTALISLVSRVVASSAVRTTIMMQFAKILIVVGIPLSLAIAFNNITRAIMSFALSKVDDAQSSLSGVDILYNLQGIAAYLYLQLGLDACIQLLITVVVTKYLLRFVPFVRL